MATIRLVPSTSAVSNASYATIADADNMYTNTDSTTAGKFTHTRASATNTYYGYLRGFNFDDVPSNANVSSFTVRIKASATGHTTSTSTNYYMSLCNNTTALSNTNASGRLTTFTTTFTFNNGTMTWDTLKGYKENFGIRIPMRRASSSKADVVSVYGAEIEVTYTVPVYHTVTATGDGTLDPSGVQSILEGTDYTLKISGITPTVTDNNVDVTSQLIQSTEATDVLVPNGYTNSGFTISNITNAYNDADNTTYADLTAPAGSQTSTIYLDIQDANIPSSATIISVSCKATLQYNRNNSSSGFTASCQMYAGSTAKGSSTSVVTAGGTDVAKTTFNLSVGSWTLSEINNARFFLTATNNAGSTQRHMYIYGVSFSVTYESEGITYIYTLTNVLEDHTIVVTASAQSQTMYYKIDSMYTPASAVYKKVNSSWVLQINLSNVFNSGTNYKPG